LKACPRSAGVSPPGIVASVLRATVCMTLTAFKGNLSQNQVISLASYICYDLQYISGEGNTPEDVQIYAYNTKQGNIFVN
jgi:hypothetical protein